MSVVVQHGETLQLPPETGEAYLFDNPDLIDEISTASAGLEAHSEFDGTVLVNETQHYSETVKKIGDSILGSVKARKHEIEVVIGAVAAALVIFPSYAAAKV